MEQRAKSGELAQELHGLKAEKVINSLTKILASLKQSAVIIAAPPPAAGDGRDPSWFRANSATNLSERERQSRRETVDAEIVKEE